MKEASGTHYNRVAGQSLERLSALSDGLFAIAMTLLMFDLRAPVASAIHGEQDLWLALTVLAPRFVMCLMSFMTLGIFWVGQQTQLNHFIRADRHLAWIHIAFLFAISTMPFSTSLLAGFITYRLALLVYWLNILLPGLMLYASWRYARHAGLVKADAPADLDKAVEDRIVIAQALYAFGVLLCVISTYLSIAWIVVVQLNYVVAPRFRPLFRR
jgi:uncharacterized membrane protein